MKNNTLDKKEIEKFSKIAEEWWNPDGKFKPLHKFNPIRISYIKNNIISSFQLKNKKKPLDKVKILDASWHLPTVKRNSFEEYKVSHIINSTFFDIDKYSNQKTNLPHMLPSKEDWEIINNLSELLKRKKIFNNKDELVDSMFNYLNLKKEDNKNESIDADFTDEKIIVDNDNYYFSNVIARASKTMTDCHNEKIKLKNTGTEG